MLKIIWRGIIANWGRLILTLISVFLGVAFVSGSFILADSLRAIFNQVSEEIFEGVDAQVQAEELEIAVSGQNLARFDESTLDLVEALPEVNVANGGVGGFEIVYSTLENGEVNRSQGPPTLTFSWAGPGPLSTFELLDGEAPVGQQVVLDQGQVDAGGFEIGGPVTMSLPNGEPEIFELSGIVSFGEVGGSSALPYFILFDLPTAQRILASEGQIDAIVIDAEQGVSTDELLEAVSAVLPDGLEVVSGEQLISDQQAEFGTIINIFGSVLLGFAVVVLFVSIFIIYNTFAILVGQRTRQLGLLRSIGASGAQIRGMVLIEAVIIGLIASVLGLFGGLGVAAGLKALFSSGGGGGFPDGPLQILPRTIVVVVLVGMGVTMISAIAPAIRASKVSPLEAVRSGGRKERSARFRLLMGAIVLVPGLVMSAIGMFTGVEDTTARLSLIGVGAALTFVGVSLVSALFASPVADFLGSPIAAATGVTGRLGRDNASRNPQRTAATATALMIGLALITGVAVLAASLLRTFDEVLEDALTADLVVFGGDQNLPFSSELVEPLEALDETDLVAALSFLEIRVGEEIDLVGAFDTDTGTAVVNYGLVEGSETLTEAGIAVFKDRAENLGLSIGDTLPVEFGNGFKTDLTIESIYDDQSIINAPYFIEGSLGRQQVQIEQVRIIGVNLDDTFSTEEARAAVEKVLEANPQLDVSDSTEFKEEAASQIGALQQVINGLLALCLIVAFFGIINTMALSILERIREIGLLRAVGMTRQQLRSSVRWEAIIVSIFGSLLGVGMGLLLGWAGVLAIPDSFISIVAIPWGNIAVYLAVGTGIGVLAAFFPALRAARMNVLEAISHE